MKPYDMLSSTNKRVYSTIASGSLTTSSLLSALRQHIFLVRILHNSVGVVYLSIKIITHNNNIFNAIAIRIDKDKRRVYSF